MRYLLQTLSLLYQGPMWKRRQKDYMSQWGQITSRKKYLSDTIEIMYIWSHKHWGHVPKPEPVLATWGPNNEREKETWALVPNKEVISYWQLFIKENSVVLSGVSLGILTMLKDGPPAQQSMANTQKKWYFCKLFVSIKFWLGIFCLSGFVFVYYGFWFCIFMDFFFFSVWERVRVCCAVFLVFFFFLKIKTCFVCLFAFWESKKREWSWVCRDMKIWKELR